MCVLSKWLELLRLCICSHEVIRLRLRGELITVLPHGIRRQSDGTFAFCYTRIKPDNTAEKSPETVEISTADICELTPTGFFLQGGKLVGR